MVQNNLLKNESISENESLKKISFGRDFIMVVIGQIISLFGNAIIRYALPLHLLNETGSASLFATVVACSFLPMIIMAPIGGMIADRVNKRNIMVILDFSTAILMACVLSLLGHMNIVALLIISLMLLFSIQGLYSPTVSASIPVLVSNKNMMSANAIINMVNSLSGLIGPIIGGILFSIWGLKPLICVSICCFIISAVMEIFIKIPFTKQETSGSIVKTVIKDMKESFRFITNTNPYIGKTALLLAVINIVFSAMIIIGLPVIVNQHLGFDQETGNRLYGYAEGALAAGGLIGGLIVGIFGKKFKINNAYKLIFFCALTLLPMALVLYFPVGNMTAYFVILASCVVMMALSNIFSIEMMTYVQIVTPNKLIGKVMSLIMFLAMFSHPIGQSIYGLLFERLKANVSIIFFVALILSLVITFFSRNHFRKIPLVETQNIPPLPLEKVEA